MSTNNSGEFTSTLILVYLRRCLLDAIEQKNINDLQQLAYIFDMLWDLVDKEKIHGNVVRILEDLGNAARDHAMGIGWKSTIPPEEEIRLALNS